MIQRLAARLLVVDPDGAVLLFRGCNPTRPEQGTWWFTPGGGVEEGENLVIAARRELFEETGLEIVDDLGAPVFERTTEFDFEERRVRQTEYFFCVRAERFTPDDSRWTDVERRFMLEHRWWTSDEIAATADTIHPENLMALLDDLLS